MATLQNAVINISSTGATTVIAGNALTPTIQVVGIYFQCGVTTTVTIKAGSTALTGPMSFTSGGGFNLPNANSNIYFECDSGSSLVFDLTGLVGSCGGSLMYYQF